MQRYISVGMPTRERRQHERNIAGPGKLRGSRKELRALKTRSYGIHLNRSDVSFVLNGGSRAFLLYKITIL